MSTYGAGGNDQVQGLWACGISPTPDGVAIKVYVAPRSSGNRIVGEHNGSLKIALAAPPVDGAANRALVEFLAKALGVPKGAVSLLSGESSRHKVVGVAGIGADEALRLVSVSD